MITIIKPILPEVVLFFGGCFILLLDAFQLLRKHLSSISTVLCLVCAAMMIYGSDGTYYSGLITASIFTKTIKIAMIALVLFQLLSAQLLMDRYAVNSNEHSVVVMFMIVGLFVMVSANHFMLLYVGMEIQALSAYTLVVMQRKTTVSAEAGVKYFILGSLASVIYLFGCSYLYGAFDSLYLGEVFSNKGSSVLGVVLVLSSFLFKVGVFPFHQWVPDVYQGAPMPSTSIISTVSKMGTVAVLLKLIIGFSKHVDLQTIVSIVAAFSMLIGAILPIVQTHIKRFLGYSAVGHAGFMLMGLAQVSSQGVSSIVAYMLVYSLTLMMTFVCLMSLQDKQATAEAYYDIPLANLEGLSQTRPKHTFVLSVCLLSMAGAPPLIGFFPKLLIMQYALSQRLIALLILAGVSAVISLFYYLKVVKLMYMDDPTRAVIDPSARVNTRLLWVFLPAMLIQVLGCYLPVLQTVYLRYIVPGTESMFIGMNEKNNSRLNS